jgi:hypothetical protein
MPGASRFLAGQRGHLWPAGAYVVRVAAAQMKPIATRAKAVRMNRRGTNGMSPDHCRVPDHACAGAGHALPDTKARDAPRQTLTVLELRVKDG